MDVPAPESGTIVSLAVSVGDEVSEGTLIGILDTEADAMPNEAGTTEVALTRPRMKTTNRLQSRLITCRVSHRRI